MKILLTGKPKSGKTTLLNDLIKSASPKRGMVATEVLQNGTRIGFDLWDDRGNTTSLARTDQPTDYPVGRYFVDVAVLDTFMDSLFAFTPDQLLYIDEIGHMQLYSQKFQDLVTKYMDAENDFIGTISSVYEHPFIDEVRSRRDVLLCTVPPDNREELKVALKAALEQRSIFNSLPQSQQDRAIELARGYLKTHQYISLRKLFYNALRYLSKAKVGQNDEGELVVRGDHNEHHVQKQNSAYSCDCDFFNGRGQFAGKAGECSHIQAVKILG